MPELQLPAGVDEHLAMKFLEAICAERKHAHEKHGATSMEASGLLDHRRASILTEEAVECARALNDHEHDELAAPLAEGVIRAHWNAGYDTLDVELIQTAAMAYTWWANRRGDRLSPPATKRKLTAGQYASYVQSCSIAHPEWSVEQLHAAVSQVYHAGD